RRLLVGARRVEPEERVAEDRGAATEEDPARRPVLVARAGDARVIRAGVVVRARRRARARDARHVRPVTVLVEAVAADLRLGADGPVAVPEHPRTRAGLRARRALPHPQRSRRAVVAG